MKFRFSAQPVRLLGKYRKEATRTVFQIEKSFSYGVREVNLKNFDILNSGTTKLLIKQLENQIKFPIKYHFKNDQLVFGKPTQLLVYNRPQNF